MGGGQAHEGGCERRIMRSLLLIPLIHSDSDLGEAAEKIRQIREKFYGADRLVHHESVMASFWERAQNRLEMLNPLSVKIYQDGMVEDGDIGRQVVNDLSTKGSPNFICISRLISAGAELRKTEDIDLIRREYTLTMNLVRARLLVQKMIHLLLLRWQKKGLLKKRDRFIAHQVNTTLQPGEVGVLFIGAYHLVTPLLNADIQVEMFKPIRLLQAYMKALKSIKGEEDLRCLSEELIK